ncbi:MAG: hypothetical protein EBR02_01280 [Alphaproteobacteria bacterium]|nr:hypothetical protein [Alphaproteobacteria bacterium]
MKVFTNFFVGILSVMTASTASIFQRSPHDTMASAMLQNWRGVAKDIKRVQGKLKAEAHDGRKKR